MKTFLIGVSVILLYLASLFFFDHHSLGITASTGTQPVVLAVAIAVLYFLPTAVALLRHIKTPQGPILLNLLLGWTGLGWIGALIWAACAPIAHQPKDKVNV